MSKEDKWDEAVFTLQQKAFSRYCKVVKTNIGMLNHPDDPIELHCETHKSEFWNDCKNNILPRHCPHYGILTHWDVANALREAYNEGFKDGSKKE